MGLNMQEFKYILPPDQWFTGRFNNYSKRKVISVIKDHLTEAQWVTLTKGCLDSIVRNEAKLPLYSQICFYMLFHEVETKKEFEMWFKLKDKLLRFSMLEFACVSGLNCEAVSEDLGSPEQVTLEEFLGVSNVCSVSDLEYYFINEPNDTPEKMVLARWLLIEAVLLPIRSKKVRFKYLSLACDIEKFEAYPWGRDVYIATIESLKSVSRVSTEQRNDFRPGFNIFGYPIAFQVCPSFGDSLFRFLLDS